MTDDLSGMLSTGIMGGMAIAEMGMISNLAQSVEGNHKKKKKGNKQPHEQMMDSLF